MNGGAVAYLTQSNYGRNKTEITINNYYTSAESPYKVAVTGLAGASISEGSTNDITNVFAYYTTNGIKASTTGNISGVYDLSGGSWEKVAGYISNGSTQLYSTGNNGSSGNLMGAMSTANVEGYKTLSTRNYTIYPWTSINQYSNNYNSYKNLLSNTYGYGDAILEVSGGSIGINSWNSDFTYFPFDDYMFFRRGAQLGDNSGTGLFCFYHTPGYSVSTNGFRTVLIAE